mgnify:CR=1 FL=1
MDNGPRVPGPFVVGVDGGGTGSRAMVMALDGREISTAAGPPALIEPRDPGAAAGAVAGTVAAALEGARVGPPAAALWAGLAGAGPPDPREAVETALRSLGIAEAVCVGMDVEAAHRDAFQGEAGILVVLGTGSMLWGRDPEGREVRVGGWGTLLGEEAGGYWFGLQGLRAVARARDGRAEPTLLSATLLEKLRLPDPPALIPWIAGASKGKVAALAPLVLEAAGQDDGPARAILDQGLAQLRSHLEVARRAWEPWGGAFAAALVGGLAEEGGPLRGLAAEAIQDAGGILREGPVVPVRGAARMALSLLRTG